MTRLRKTLTYFFFFLMTGCAAYKSYNQTTLGSVVFRGGVSKEKTWDDALTFKRMSWYHGMTLYFDFMVWKVNVRSPFMSWFSVSERELVSRCHPLIVTVSYSADPDKISQTDLKKQLEKNGFKSVVVSHFHSALKTHPSAQDWRLKSYKFSGFCKSTPSQLKRDKLAINFPSFSQLELNL